MSPDEASASMELVGELAKAIADVGREMGLPYVAASADIGSPDPIVGPDGQPFAESLFRWLDPKLEYWKDRSFALRSPLIHASRAIAEPFYYREGRYGAWRPSAALVSLAGRDAETFETYNVGAAIVAPAYHPGGIMGAVAWATPDRTLDVAAIYAERAASLHALAMRFTGAYLELSGRMGAPVRLTRREIQCLKWAAAGKTDGEVSEIVGISLPTVRFHITNAARKLGVPGRSQAVHRAATLGYIGAAAGGR